MLTSLLSYLDLALGLCLEVYLNMGYLSVYSLFEALFCAGCHATCTLQTWDTHRSTLSFRPCSVLGVTPPVLYKHGILTGLLSLSGLALDWVSRHLYFTNMGYSEPGLDGAVYSWHRVEMISLHKAQRKTVVTDVERPRGLDIDINAG